MVRDLLLGQTVDKVRHSLGVPMLIARPDRAMAAAAHQDEGGGTLFRSWRCQRQRPIRRRPVDPF